MIVIEAKKDKEGRRRNQIGNDMIVPDGYLEVPPELEDEALSYLPFIEITVDDGEIVAVAQGEAVEEEPPEPQPDPQREIEDAIVELAALVNDTISAVTELAAMVGGDT